MEVISVITEKQHQIYQDLLRNVSSSWQQAELPNGDKFLYKNGEDYVGLLHLVKSYQLENGSMEKYAEYSKQSILKRHHSTLGAVDYFVISESARGGFELIKFMLNVIMSYSEMNGITHFLTFINPRFLRLLKKVYSIPFEEFGEVKYLEEDDEYYSPSFIPVYEIHSNKGRYHWIDQNIVVNK